MSELNCPDCRSDTSGVCVRHRSLTNDERFNDIEPMSYLDVSASLDDGSNLCFIEVQVRQVLTVNEARALRDWLNKVLP